MSGDGKSKLPEVKSRSMRAPRNQLREMLSEGGESVSDYRVRHGASALSHLVFCHESPMGETDRRERGTHVQLRLCLTSTDFEILVIGVVNFAFVN